MAKTRRKKINRSPGTPYGRNTRAAVVEKGNVIKTSGVRKVLNETKGSKDAKQVHVGRHYTGVPKGKIYPYAGRKRGGPDTRPLAAQILDGLIA